MFNKCSMTLKPSQTIKPFVALSQMPSHCKPTPMYRLARHDDLSKPETCSLEDWHAACCDFLSLNPAPPAPIHGTQQSIDEYWSCLSDHFETMLRAARRSFHEPDVRTKPKVTKKVGLSFLKVFRLFTVSLTKPLTLSYSPFTKLACQTERMP